uniref:Uncharacterized protein n=1 Tax=Leptocylindrus danicus TaxID=163516 RepID=A0A7S2JQ46_9STRA
MKNVDRQMMDEEEYFVDEIQKYTLDVYEKKLQLATLRKELESQRLCAISAALDDCRKQKDLLLLESLFSFEPLVMEGDCIKIGCSHPDGSFTFVEWRISGSEEGVDDILQVGKPIALRQERVDDEIGRDIPVVLPNGSAACSVLAFLLRQNECTNPNWLVQSGLHKEQTGATLIETISTTSDILNNINIAAFDLSLVDEEHNCHVTLENGSNDSIHVHVNVTKDETLLRLQFIFDCHNKRSVCYSVPSEVKIECIYGDVSNMSLNSLEEKMNTLLREATFPTIVSRICRFVVCEWPRWVG